MISQGLLLAIAFGFFMSLSLALYFRIIWFTLSALLVGAVLSNLIYFSMDSAKGWPADAKDIKGIVAAVVVVNPSETDDGGIYISVFSSLPVAWLDYVYERKAPRTYYIKYTTDRAAEFEKAKKAIADGVQVRIDGIPPENAGEGKGSGEGADGKAGILGDILEKLGFLDNNTYNPDTPEITYSPPDELLKKE